MMTIKTKMFLIMNKREYALEKKLMDEGGELHTRFVDTVFALQRILSNYKLIFPEFTDHTELHTLSIIDFCNQLIGDQIDKLNIDEIYCILMGCYFHDTGMGVSQVDFDEFSEKINFKDYFLTHDKNNKPEIIRNFHNEYSALFLDKYTRFFEIPSPEHLFAIKEISRGHRKTDLFNEKEYPIELKLSNGNTICLPYLTALVRLADEIDVTAARNSHAIYDLSKITHEIDLIEFMKHEAVKDLVIEKDKFIMKVSPDNDEMMESLMVIAHKMQKTLDLCRNAVNGRTPFTITQEKVEVEKI